jgi:hypothetical protein
MQIFDLEHFFYLLRTNSFRSAAASPRSDHLFSPVSAMRPGTAAAFAPRRGAQPSDTDEFSGSPRRSSPLRALELDFGGVEDPEPIAAFPLLSELDEKCVALVQRLEDRDNGALPQAEVRPLVRQCITTLAFSWIDLAQKSCRRQHFSETGRITHLQSPRT